MHLFNLCMLCFFLLCINAYLHLFLLVFMIASYVYNIIAFRLLGCILVYLCSPYMIACGVQKLWAMRWSTSAGRPAQLTGAKRPVACRWSCAGPHQRKATSVDRPVWLRWTGACVSACRPAPKQKCACALVLCLSSSAGPPAHRAIFWRVFKTTSLHLWPLYIC